MRPGMRVGQNRVVNPSTAHAAVIVDELIRGGVTDAVLCPGSRSAPLAYALHRADAAGRIRLHVRVDERGAGFLAVGLARASGRPAAVITTSGTAVANVHPAVLEAHHGAVPMLVVTADRPPQLHGVGANQVIDQLTVFGSGVVRYQHNFAVARRAAGQNAYWRSHVCRALAAARGLLSGGWSGPAHLNVPLDVPLVPDCSDGAWTDFVESPGSDDWPEPLTGRANSWTTIGSRAGGAAGGSAPMPLAPIPLPEPDEKCLFIADLGHPLAESLADSGFLVISESGGLAGASVLGAGMLLLADGAFVNEYRPDRVVVLGRPTLFRAVNQLLARADVVVDVVDHPARYADIAGAARTVGVEVARPAAADLDSVGSRAAWSDAWRTADLRARGVVESLLSRGDVANSAVMARVVARSLPDGAHLFAGSSQLPRDLARFTSPRNGVYTLANRGVAGIDGSVSTAIGAALALASQDAAVPGSRVDSSATPAFAVMGDLTFVHDMSALAIGPHEPRPDLTLIVANNDGGGIFATLEQGAPERATAFERVFGTPTGAQIAQIAEAFGHEHVLATTTDELADVVREPPHGLRIVEVPISRADLRGFDATVARAVGTAISTEASTAISTEVSTAVN